MGGGFFLRGARLRFSIKRSLRLRMHQLHSGHLVNTSLKPCKTHAAHYRLNEWSGMQSSDTRLANIDREMKIGTIVRLRLTLNKHRRYTNKGQQKSNQIFRQTTTVLYLTINHPIPTDKKNVYTYICIYTAENSRVRKKKKKKKESLFAIVFKRRYLSLRDTRSIAYSRWFTVLMSFG